VWNRVCKTNALLMHITMLFFVYCYMLRRNFTIFKVSIDEYFKTC